jgi:glycosyltransferase involved in cell wall biosynthesis
MIVAVVPALDEEQSIEGVVAGALRYVDTVIVIDDGSTDATRDRALAAGARVVSHGRNRGVGAAIASGLAEAIAIGATVVVQIDGDGQHAVEFVADLVKEVLAGADLAVGNRFANEFEMGRARRFALRLFGWIIARRLHQPIDDPTSGFRAFSVDAATTLLPVFPTKYLSDTVEVLFLAAERHLVVRAVPVRMMPRTSGEASVGLIKGVGYSLRMLSICVRHLITTSRTARR